MAPSTVQLLKFFEKPTPSNVACQQATNEEMILWYLRVNTWLFGTLLAVGLVVLATRLSGRSLSVPRQVDETLDSSVSDTQQFVIEPEIQPQGFQPWMCQPWLHSETESNHGSVREGSIQVNMPRHFSHPDHIRPGGSRSEPYTVLRQKNRGSAQTQFRESDAFVSMHEFDDIGRRRRRQGHDILRGIRGGGGDETEIKSQREDPLATEEANLRDDLDTEQYFESMSEYLEVEDLLEATINDFDELESHQDGTLLREALVRNERTRLRRDYRELKDRLDHLARGLGFEPEDLDTEEMHGLEVDR